MSRSLVVALADALATERAGEGLAKGLVPGMVVTLSGPLGAGKTTFARGVLRALGWTGAVKSPTFALVEHYPLSNLYLYHFDFYRFGEAAEWDDAGVSEAFARGSVCLIEWPERVAQRLPVVDVAIALSCFASGAQGRELHASAATSGGEQCLTALAAAVGSIAD
ncbi:MAG TPA: tRNA (adenosine(37)-N6)-threonylcarbamoyltransferase complex ATPase subunit type 1 TsaE [Casimicrobiaceae bacterium]|nr:tRNA (adenosine(37)-N6)-threonylcarbamoyltransferase complex ATPase subunit type 1 TsaE [Casimicrobiaceae bacterium]